MRFARIPRVALPVVVVLLCACAHDVTHEYDIPIKKNVSYTLQEDVFYRVYDDVVSLHPPNSHWADLTFEEFRQDPEGAGFIKGIVPEGTTIEFVGAIEEFGWDHPTTNFWGRITSGEYEGRQRVLLGEIMGRFGAYEPTLARTYLGVE